MKLYGCDGWLPDLDSNMTTNLMIWNDLSD